MENVLQDLRYGIRVLWARPGFMAVAVLTLALGIGANTAIFSVVNAVLLKALPYAEAERLVHPVSTNARLGLTRGSIPYADFADWRDQSNLFERLALYRRQNIDLTGEGEPERLNGLTVSEGYFTLMKVQPVLGRTFRPEDHKPDAERVAVISQGLWQRRFGSNPKILGQAIRLSGTPYTVIGVIAQDSVWPDDRQAWSPLRFGEPTPDMTRRDNMNWQAVARLKTGVSLPQAKAQLAVMARQIEQQFPESRKGWGMDVIELRDFILGPQLQLSLLVLLGAVAFMLLIACVNVANLLLARAAFA